MKLHLIPIFLSISVLVVSSSGCAGRTAANLNARRLSSSIQLYQNHLDAFIDHQKQLYQDRKTQIQNSRSDTIQLELGNLRISQANAAAEKMIGNPVTELRPSKLTEYLKVTHQQEEDLFSKLLQHDEQDKKDLEQRTSALQSKKALSEKIRNSLLQLSRGASLTGEAKDLEEFGGAVKAEIDKLKEKKSQ